MRGRRAHTAAVLLGGLAAVVLMPAAAGAQVAGISPAPIPTDPLATAVPEFVGSPANPHRVRAPLVPQHPFMAPNGVSNIHDDAYQTDTYRGDGPLGLDVATDSALFARECASITFDSQGRLVTICVGLDRPVLALLDPDTREPLATFALPPRTVGGGNPFTDFSGGGYFYLDQRDRAVAPTTTRHVLVVAETDGPGFELRHDYDLTGAVADGDKIISALPDWRGRIWFASTNGVVGYVSRRSGKVHARSLDEPIGNSFAVDERGGVYIVTDAALYRFRASHGKVRTVWRHGYANTGLVKPGQTQAGSGTTPTLIGGPAHKVCRQQHVRRRSRRKSCGGPARYVAITDNADPLNVVVFQRSRRARGRRVVCREPIFEQGASATDQSLIGAGRSLVAENNYGYSIAATEGGATTEPGLQRVDLDRDGRGCHTIWRSDESAPSVVPKLSLRDGLVYTYTKPQRDDGKDAWYLTALDFRNGETDWKRLAGVGLGFNNNYAPVSIAPDGTAYVGVLGGVTMFRDTP
jgi:hypothetical protein